MIGQQKSPEPVAPGIEAQFQECLHDHFSPPHEAAQSEPVPFELYADAAWIDDEPDHSDAAAWADFAEPAPSTEEVERARQAEFYGFTKPFEYKPGTCKPIGLRKPPAPKPAPPVEVLEALPEEAVDIFGRLEPPTFPVHLLPSVVAAFAQDQADLIGVDPAVIGMAALGALAGCLDDRLKIQPKRHDPTWTESARLWIGIIGDPSAKKSPGISRALAPARRIAAKWREDHRKAQTAWEREAKERGDSADLPPAPMEKRLIASDCTVEKLGDILAKAEPRGILIDRDELTGWLASMDAYRAGSGGKDKAAWLEAYNGGSLQIDRVSRGSLWVENWSACVVGGIQPSVIHDYANSTSHDGMLQRFLLIHAGQARQGKDRRPDIAAMQSYEQLVEHLSEVRGQPGRSVKLSEQAHQVREQFNEKLHKATVAMPNKHLSAALGKWEGMFARLLLIYHAAECASLSIHPIERTVSEDSAHRVATLLWRVILPHTMAFYDGLDPADQNARALAGLLLARGWARFTVKRDLHNHMLAWRKLRDWERDEVLDRLEAYGWISPEISARIGDRGRPASYLVNTSVHERFTAFAERERERRAAVVEVMRELRA